MTEHMSTQHDGIIRLGVVSFLNACPLTDSLTGDASIRMQHAVPARLPQMLENREVDAALVPSIDWIRRQERWQRVSDACIGCDGESLTVRVFSRRPADTIATLHVDGDSHTSVALARILWSRCFGRPVTIRPLADANAAEAVLLIGDKVIAQPQNGFGYEIDLGQAWKDWTGLPFVFAVWAARAESASSALSDRLSAARDDGVTRAGQIARRQAPRHGWPAETAVAYLTRHMKYTITEDAEAGLRRFCELAADEGIVPASGVTAL